MKYRKYLSWLFIILLLVQLMLPVCAASKQTADEPEEEAVEVQEEEAFSVAAKAALLVDINTDHIIYEQNIDDQVYPASLTKIMTCLLVLENGNLSDTVTVDEDAYWDVSESGSSAGLVVGETLTVEQLLYCMMIVSGDVTSFVAGYNHHAVKQLHDDCIRQRSL